MAVDWIVTPNDDTDGGMRAYLDKPQQWCGFDGPPFEHLAAALADGAEPCLAMPEDHRFLQARYSSEVVPDYPRAAPAPTGVAGAFLEEVLEEAVAV